MYLGTKHTPATYYEAEGRTYTNPHEVRVRSILDRLSPHIEGSVLDLGCGDGLVTKWIASRWPAMGVESSLMMVERYQAETGLKCRLQPFWAELPVCDTIIASYSLHLCPRSRLHELRYALQSCNAARLIVVSPLKSVRTDLGLPVTAETSITDPKTTYGWVFQLNRCSSD